MGRETGIAIMLAALAVAACAAPSHSGDGLAYATDGVRNVEYGQVERVDLYSVRGDAALGNDIGRSPSFDAMRYRIVVRLDTDALLTIDDRRSTDLRPGDRVRVENGSVKRG